jgi:tetratricopeptide (TPR) repeat protein
LGQQDPERYLPELAGVSNDLGCALREQGRPSEALFHAEKAVEMFELVVQGDGAELHHLAGAHLNLAKVHSMLEDHDRAIAASREGLRMFEALAEALPHHFAQVHVQAMDDLSAALVGAGQIDEALALTERAAKRVGQLAREAPNALEIIPLVARIANNLGRRHARAGHLEEALPWARQAVQGYGLLLRNNPVFLEPAIQSRHNLAQNLEELGRIEEAHAVNAETLELARELGGMLLVSTLHEQGRLAHALARFDEAIECAIAALQILEPIWRADHEEFIDIARRLGAEIIEYCEDSDADLPADIVELLEELAGET